MADPARPLNRVRKGDTPEPDSPLVGPGEPQKQYPLSAGQRRLWFFEQLHPGTRAHFLPFALDLTGPLDVDRLDEALNDLMRRHETLRTRFVQRAHETFQCVEAAMRVPLAIVDLAAASGRERDAELARVAAEQRSRQFDFERGPLWRVTLVRLAAERFQLLVVLHHLISDAWSFGVFVHDLAAFYTARVTGAQPVLPALPVQYGDVALRQLQDLRAGALREGLDFWRDTLQGAPATLDLPTDYRRGRAKALHSARVSATVPADLVRRLRFVSRRHGATLFMGLAAAFGAVLSRVAGARDVVIGTPLAARASAEVRPVLGLFMNTLPLRMRLDETATFGDLLGQVRGWAVVAYRHQAVPFDAIVADVHPHRERAQAPVFQVLFNMIDPPFAHRVMMGPVSAQFVGDVESPSEFDLTLYAIPGQGGLDLTLLYDADLFTAERAAAQLEQYVKTLTAVTEAPTARLSALDVGGFRPDGLVEFVARPRLPAERASSGREAPPRPVIPPATATEAELLSIWREVLEVDRIGREDSFFELGGHSLLAMQVALRVRARLGADVPLRAIFEAPTIAGLAEIIDRAPHGPGGRTGPGREESESIAGLDRRRRRADPLTVEPLGRDRPARIAVPQQRIWFLQQLDPDGSAYNLCVALRLTGTFSRDAFAGACTELIRRHAALRTTFVVVDDVPVQQIHPPAPAVITELDVRSRPLDERADAALQYAAEDADRPFDSRVGPLIRISLVRQADDVHLAVLTGHHLICDQWSYGVIGRELSELYAAFVEHREARLADLTISYADFSEQQRAWLDGPRLQDQMAYWKRQLDGLTAPELPTDRPRRGVAMPRGAHDARPLAPDLLHALRSVAASQQATLFMTLVAAFDVVLARHTGRTDVSVGLPIANRAAVETEGLVGTFVNTLVFRTDVSGDPTFRELLGRVREVALDAFANQDLPFERLVSEMKPDRGTNRPPFFQVLFNVQNGLQQWPELPGLRLDSVPVPARSTQFDLAISVDPGGHRLRYSYNTDLFDAATVGRLIDHYTACLEAVARDPDIRIGRIPLMSREERSLVVEQWNATRIPFAGSETVVSLFERQAAAHPAAAAVTCGEARVDYRTLNAQADRVAARLRALGCDASTLVGVCLERSVEMVAALLAVLKAGGAYVPLDPTLPEARLAFMIRDAGVRILLTHSSLRRSLPLEVEHVVCLDALEEAIDRVVDAEHLAADRPVQADSLAYVIYTSGSTGQPKAVEVTHRALANVLRSFQRQPGFAASDRLLAMTTMSFDIAALEIFLPLIVGGEGILATREAASDPEQIARLIERHDVTVMQATPAAWRLLIDGGWRGRPSLTALCGGEALPRDLADDLLRRVRALWNVYGPTETTIWSTIERVGHGEGPVSIGRPIANTEIYVLEAAGEPAPIGVVGELFIGGAGVARGYRNRRQLTAERFVPDPFSGREDARLYRTGDLARIRADGRLEYIGRIDDQVKVRGFRIELGEIEQVLAAHTAVQQAVVTVRRGASGDARLVAYVVAGPGAAVTVSDLRRHLKAALPDYMVPSFFVELAALPRTHNGKIDRAALPDPIGAAVVAAAEPPRTTVERHLADMWRQAVGAPSVSLADRFFDIGGHSLLALQVLIRIEREFGVRLGPRAMIMDTLEQVAAEIAGAAGFPRRNG